MSREQLLLFQEGMMFKDSTDYLKLCGNLLQFSTGLNRLRHAVYDTLKQHIIF